MSGPSYPASPASGSNAIGSFIIGVSQIGTISPFDIWQTVISQFANSPILTGMIESFNAAVDMTENLDNFFDMVMNVDTAEGYGLNCWGTIVGAPRTIPVTGVVSAPTFGFNEPGNDWVGFNQAPFTQGQGLANNVTLTDEQYRPLILAKAATNIWDGSIPGLNSILLAYFSGRGTPYVQDGLDMGVTYVFPFSLTPLDIGILQSTEVFPQMTGIVVNTSSP